MNAEGGHQVPALCWASVHETDKCPPHHGMDILGVRRAMNKIGMLCRDEECYVEKCSGEKLNGEGVFIC